MIRPNYFYFVFHVHCPYNQQPYGDLAYCSYNARGYILGFQLSNVNTCQNDDDTGDV